MNTNWILYFFGAFFLGIGLTAIFNTIYIGNTDGILWLCYMSMFIISIGMFFKDDGLIMSQLNIIFIPLLFWNVDFFYVLHTKS